MISIKEHTKKELLEGIQQRFNKIANLLDEEDYLDFIEESIVHLNDAMYNSRSYLFTADDYVQYNGSGTFLDVTNLKIEEICNVYYSDKDQYNANFFFEELGLLPFVSQSSGFANTLSQVTNYLLLQTNLNMLNRQMELCNDWELWPIDKDGKQMLQMRTATITRVEFLPYIDYFSDSWVLFDHEWAFLKKLVFAKCMRRNVEIQASASTLGVAKEANNLVTYWSTQEEKIIEDFSKHQIITYLQ